MPIHLWRRAMFRSGRKVKNFFHSNFSFKMNLLILSLALSCYVVSGEYGWVAVEQDGHIPPALSAHSIDSRQNLLYVFGGVDLNFSAAMTDNAIFYNNIYSFNTIAKKWLLLWDGAWGGGPSKRAFHTSFIGSSSAEKVDLIIHGGSNFTINNTQSFVPPYHNATYQHINIFSDTWAYNLPTDQWRLIESVQSPGPLTSAAMDYDENKQGWLFGGFNSTFPFTFLNHLWRYNFTEDQWYLVGANGDPGAPPARWACQLMSDKDGHLFMYGGRNTTHIFNDMWRYTISSGIWDNVTPIAPEYNIDPPRHETHAVFLTYPYIVLYGGQGGAGGVMGCGSPEPQNPTYNTYVFDIELDIWIDLLYPSNARPPPLVRSRMTKLGYVLFLFGGFDFECPGQGVLGNRQLWSCDIFA